jgi:hypothetical protein
MSRLQAGIGRSALWSAKTLGLVQPRGLNPCEFGAAGLVERCKVVLDDLPQERRRNLPVFVAQDVPHGCDLPPRDARISILHGIGQSSAGLRHDLDPMLNDSLLLLISLEYLKRRGACLFADMLSRLDDIRQAGDD